MYDCFFDKPNWRTSVNKFYLFSAITLLNLPFLSAQENKPDVGGIQKLSSFRQGADAIGGLRKAYEEGSYDAFLANLQSDYQAMVESGKLDEFSEMRDAPTSDDQVEQVAKEWESIHHKLITDRNEQLLTAIAGQENEMTGKLIRSICASLPNDQREAILYLSSLRFKLPKNAVSEDEKKLIEIDIAAEFKAIHLDAQYAEKPFEDRMEQHVIIGMETMHRMEEISQAFKNNDLQKTIALAAKGYDQWQIRNWDLNLLNQIIKRPTSDIEKKIASVMQDYQTKKSDLYQKEFLAKIVGS
jgi:hypothetical protein